MPRAVFVSDLHLGLGPDHNVEDFFADDAFVAFLDDPLLSPSDTGDVELVLLGDTFDLWQSVLDVREYRADKTSDINLVYTALDERELLQRIGAAHPTFLPALGRFADRPGCRLTLVPGNHDHSLIEESHLQAAIRERTSPRVTFLNQVDRPDLRLYAEHGNQWDDNNKYADFAAFGAEHEPPGYYYIRLFMNRLKTAEPRAAELPRDLRKVWRPLLAILGSNPQAVTLAMRLWGQYRTDPRLSLAVNPFRGAAAAGGAAADAPPQAVGVDGPDLLVQGQALGDRVFSLDPETENALRRLYHTQPEVRRAVDQIRPRNSPPVPPADQRAAAEAATRGLFTQEFPGLKGARALFDPAEGVPALDPAKYRTVIFGHTHAVGERLLDNGAWYLNTGTWTGRHRNTYPVVVAETHGDGVRFGLTSYVVGQGILVSGVAWHEV